MKEDLLEVITASWDRDTFNQKWQIIHQQLDIGEVQITFFFFF